MQNQFLNKDQTYNDVMSELQDYILDDKNIEKSLEMKITDLPSHKENLKLKTKHETVLKPTNKIFIPEEKDTLFWCFYIMKNGEVNYEMLLHKNEVVAKQIMISYVENIRKDKKTVKIYKFDSISSIESNLANDNAINCKTFLTLCAIENINIIYVTKNTYYELLMNDSSDIFIVYKMNNPGYSNYNPSHSNYNIKYGLELGNSETISNIKNNLYKLDKIDKPIKAISTYTIQELLDICNKLAIETINKDTNKTKSKKDLYEGIIQHF
jgi:hypothetical protein